MKKVNKNTEIRCSRGEIPLYFLYTTGVAGERFFNGLKDGKLISSICPECGKRYLPPRIYCEECFREIEKFVEVESSGIIESFTDVYLTVEEERLKEGVRLALVRVEGTDGRLILKSLDKNLKIGGRVKIVFEKKRKGDMKDIKGVKRV